MYRFSSQPFLSDIWEIWQWKNSSENKTTHRSNHRTFYLHTNEGKKSTNILRIFSLFHVEKNFIRMADLLYKCNHVNINHIAKLYAYILGVFDVCVFAFAVVFLRLLFLIHFWLTVTRVNNLFWVCSMSTNKIKFSEEFAGCLGIPYMFIPYFSPVYWCVVRCALLPFFSAFLFISRVR